VSYNYKQGETIVCVQIRVLILFIYNKRPSDGVGDMTLRQPSMT